MSGFATGRPAVERMESRLLLSAARPAKHPASHRAARGGAGVMVPIAQPHYQSRAAGANAAATPAYVGSSTPLGSPPATIRGAYGLGPYGASTVTFGSVQGDGSGQTIAIIDAYDDPTAATDLNAFSTQFGLPTLTSNANLATINSAAGPTFTKVSQTGSTTALPGTDPAGPFSSTGGNSWEQEEALDTEWAHVMAPMANIVLVECASDTTANLIGAGAEWARNQAGVVVVTMSYTRAEFAGETAFDANLASLSTHTGGSATSGGPQIPGGVTFLAPAGDSGIYAPNTTTVTPVYPAASPNVVAVGGTTLVTSGTAYGSESAWGNGTASGTSGGGGGGVSAYEAQPSYQSGVVSAFSTTKRTYPDLSIEADPSTGVPIYDAYDFGAATPWIPGYEGGTSLSSPLVAGLVAVADQGRALEGLGSLAGASQALPAIYASGTHYHDITTGNNGDAAGTGYDVATGRGSPVANLWVVDLAALPSTGTVTGRVFQDNNADNVFSGTDTALAGKTVYVDANNDGMRQAYEPATTTDANGLYTFTGVVAGVTSAVRLVTPLTGYVAVTAGTVTPVANATTTDNLGQFPTAYADATSGRGYTVRINPSLSTQVQVLVGGTVTDSAPATLPPSLSFTFTGVGESLAVDLANGNPVPAGGISVNGTAAADNDALVVLGSAGADAVTFTAASVQVGTSTIAFAAVPNLSVDPRGGTDALTVNAGTVTVPAQAGGGIVVRQFSALAVASGATLRFATAASHADRAVVVATSASAVSVAGTGRLDLGGNDMVVRSAAASTLAGYLAAGFGGGTWAGSGISSSAAAADATRRTALGMLLNAASGAAIYTSFDGVAVGTTDLLVKYTYYGDANLSGTVNAADYTRTDAGYILGQSGWANGDYNYDGTVDGSDYALIDNTFNQQGLAL